MVIQQIPGAQFVLEIVAAVTVVITVISYRRKELNPSVDVGREVANVSAIVLALTTGFQLLLLVVR